MAGRSYPRQDIVSFGRQLLTTGDLDPVYLGLIHAKKAWPHGDWMARWLTAYWCFYNAGAASYIAQLGEGGEFWRLMKKAAENKEPTPFGSLWPRGSERRHFRGRKAVKAVELLQTRHGTAEAFLRSLYGQPMTVSAITSRASTNFLFGGWIGFKMADMIDAVGLARVDQSDVSSFLYDTPKASIQQSYPGFIPGGDMYEPAMDWLRSQMFGADNPHKPNQPVDNFCLETIWCKHLSHLHGHYPPLKDTIELHHGVQPWVKYSVLAATFKVGLPRLPKFKLTG